MLQKIVYNSKQKKSLISISTKLSPNIIIGKSKIEENVINSINQVLKSNELIKIKILNTVIEDSNTSKNFAEHCALLTQSSVIHRIGHVFILFKPRKLNSEFDISENKILKKIKVKIETKKVNTYEILALFNPPSIIHKILFLF